MKTIAMMGRVDRLLVSYPDSSPPQHWSEATVNAATVKAVSAVFQKLYTLPLAPNGPIRVHMDAEAKRLWIEWYERHQAEQAEAPENLWGAFAKMPIQAARLVLIAHLVRWAAGEKVALEVADRVSAAHCWPAR